MYALINLKLKNFFSIKALISNYYSVKVFNVKENNLILDILHVIILICYFYDYNNDYKYKYLNHKLFIRWKNLKKEKKILNKNLFIEKFSEKKQ